MTVHVHVQSDTQKEVTQSYNKKQPYILPFVYLLRTTLCPFRAFEHYCRLRRTPSVYMYSHFFFTLFLTPRSCGCVRAATPYVPPPLTHGSVTCTVTCTPAYTRTQQQQTASAGTAATARRKRTTFLVSFLRPPTRNETCTCTSCATFANAQLSLHILLPFPMIYRYTHCTKQASNIPEERYHIPVVILLTRQCLQYNAVSFNNSQHDCRW